MQQKRSKKTNKDKKAIIRHSYYRRLIFVGLLIIFLLIGLIFARPKTSAVEKRDLAAFPAFTLKSIWNGDFFSDLTTWYADTYPSRENMISIDTALQNIYGIRGQKLIVNEAQNVEDIPDAEEGVIAETMAIEQTTEERTTEYDGEELKEDAFDNAVHVQPESVGSIYIADGCGFGVYYFAKENVDAYASMINTVQSQLGDQCTIYSMPAPDNFGVMLDKEVQESISQYEGDAFDYLFSTLDPDIKPVKIYNTLVNHNTEYLYFHTDHHWTALGAYYAYTVFCKTKGIEPHDLSEYEERVFPDFLGTFYAYSNQSPELAANPDTIYAYVPLSTNTMMLTDHSWNTFEFPIIQEEGNTYDIFIGSDEPFEEVDNPKLNDGSSCVLIKDSYGNAFAPFLVDHYDKLYIVDYRYYGTGLAQFIRDNDVDDIIFVNNMEILTGDTAQMCFDLFGF